jgi:hypothetical protein
LLYHLLPLTNFLNGTVPFRHGKWLTSDHLRHFSGEESFVDFSDSGMKGAESSKL